MIFRPTCPYLTFKVMLDMNHQIRVGPDIRLIYHSDFWPNIDAVKKKLSQNVLVLKFKKFKAKN